MLYVQLNHNQYFIDLQMVEVIMNASEYTNFKKLVCRHDSVSNFVLKEDGIHAIVNGDPIVFKSEKHRPFYTVEIDKTGKTMISDDDLELLPISLTELYHEIRKEDFYKDKDSFSLSYLAYGWKLSIADAKNRIFTQDSSINIDDIELVDIEINDDVTEIEYEYQDKRYVYYQGKDSTFIQELMTILIKE